jgi:hypothetical protein
MAVGGYQVVLRDINEAFIAKGMARIEKNLARSVDKGRMDAADRDATLARLSTTTAVNDLADCDLIVEAVFEDVELKLNRAAEDATPKAKQLFWNAISAMTIRNVKQIYNGPDDAATEYFKGKMTSDLLKEMQPIIENSLSRVGEIQSYDAMMSKYKSLPFVPDIKANLTDHVLEKGMEGIFYYMAREEAAIRQNPAKRTTEILKKVFTR